jgi:hypothetical protein
MGPLSNRIIQLTCNAVSAHLNHRRIFLFSTRYGVGLLLCMRNINCKPHWLAICCMIDRQYSSYHFLVSDVSIEKKIKYSRQIAYSQSMRFAINIWILGILRFKSIHLPFYTFMHITHMYISNDSNVILKYFHFALLVVFF